MKNSRLFFAVLGLLASAGFCSAQDQKLSQQDIDYFEKKVRPLLAKRCFSCHSKDAKIVQGLSLIHI